MQDDGSEIEVVVPVEENDLDSLELGKTIWNEITAGVGIWGAFRPIFAVALSLIPFLYDTCLAKTYELYELAKFVEKERSRE